MLLFWRRLRGRRRTAELVATAALLGTQPLPEDLARRLATVLPAGSAPPSASARATSCTRPRTPGQASSASDGQRTTRTPCRSQSRCSPW